MHAMPEDPNPEGSRQPMKPWLDPGSIGAWLGTTFVALQAPSCRIVAVGQSSARTVPGTPGNTKDLGAEKPISVRIRYELPDSSVIDLATMRDYTGGASLPHHMWEVLVNYQLQLMGIRGRWAGGPPPPEAFDGLDMNSPPEIVGTRSLILDGVEVAWMELVSSDVGTDEPLSSCGFRLGNSLLSVAGPVESLSRIELQTWTIDGTPTSTVKPGT